MYSNHRTCISVPHFVGVFVYAGTINRSPTAACGLPFRCERFVNNATLTHEIGCEHPARRRGPIHRARILALSNTYIHVIKYVFPFQRTRISTLSITCFHIIEYVYSFHRIRAFALPHTHIHITEYVFSHY